LSNRIQANIDILKKLEGVEMKRVKVMPRSNPKELELQKEKIETIRKFAKGEKDTRIGILNYAQQAIEDLKGIEESMARRTFTGMPSFATLRRAKSFIQSYSGFIKDMRNAIIDTEKDEEVPDFLTDIELEDGTKVSMTSIINELDALSNDLVARYDKYSKAAITEFFRPFYGDSVTITTGSRKGQKISLEQVIEEASSDISFLDMWLDSMADSSDVFLQLFDAVAKQANDNARMKTMRDSREIQRLRLIAEENGITSFEWIHERDDEGHKTGEYVGEFNVGLFRKEKRKFIESLDKRYGRNPKGEDARQKVKALRDWNIQNADAADPNMPKQIDRWRNKAYADIMADPARKQAYEGFLELKWKADSQYPDNRVSPLKAIQRRKSSGNRIVESLAHPLTLVDNIKESVR